MRAQDASSPQLSTFEIPAGDLASQSAALSPDGKQVVALYLTRMLRPGPADITVRLRLWKVGEPNPIASSQVSARPEDGEVADDHGYVGNAAYTQYCNNGSGIMLADLDGTLRNLNPGTLEVVHATATNMTSATHYDKVINVKQMMAHCAAKSPRAVVAVFGGIVGPADAFQYDHSVLVRVYDLSSSALVREWNLSDQRVDDIAISPSGNSIAVLHRLLERKGRPEDPNYLELFDVNTGTSTLQMKTGNRPVRIAFAGETRVASVEAPDMWSAHTTIKLWDVSDGKVIREFGADQLGARRLVRASSDGSVILGYIPRETMRGRDSGTTTSDRRFRLWDAATGRTIATSPPTYPQQTSKNCWICEPGLELSASGNAVVVFAAWRWAQLPIYVYSLPPAATPEH